MKANTLIIFSSIAFLLFATPACNGDDPLSKQEVAAMIPRASGILTEQQYSDLRYLRALGPAVNRPLAELLLEAKDWIVAGRIIALFEYQENLEGARDAIVQQALENYVALWGSASNESIKMRGLALGLLSRIGRASDVPLVIDILKMPGDHGKLDALTALSEMVKEDKFDEIVQKERDAGRIYAAEFEKHLESLRRGIRKQKPDENLNGRAEE